MVKFYLRAPKERSSHAGVHSWTDELLPRNREPFWLDLVPRHVMNAPAPQH
jgi:hypothetical protein